MQKKSNNEKTESIVELDTIQENKITLDDVELSAHSDYFYNRLKKRHADDFHSQMLVVLTHELLPEVKAETLWHKIRNHMCHLDKTLQRKVGIAVAAMDYLTNIDTTITSPVLIDTELSADILKSATKDTLTGLYTREFFDCALDREIAHFHRTKEKLSLINIDIDDFKHINDKYGHQKGDQVLTEVARLICNNIREIDFACRYGGDEMVVIMPRCEIDKAHKIAERIQEKILDSSVTSELKLTISIGISMMDNETKNKAMLMRQADTAMYRSKEAGKNKISLFSK